MDHSAVTPDRAALFLDFDGTLVEIAPRPDAVLVPTGLPPLLRRLAERLDGALAIVSGRSLPDLEARLPVPLPMAGDHGASLRPAPGAPVETLLLPHPPPAWREAAEALAAAHPGALVEAKPHGFVLHYRLAPQAAGAARALLDGLITDNGEFVIMPARMAFEVKPAAVSKATAVAGLMARAPFMGRMPVFVGDDVTDEAGMQAARAAGGLGLRLQDAFGNPAGLRDWLARLAAAPPS
ncbi:trehalose-phosphatase [Falsiroseomonas sp. HW251]|uniref:trehalose-phosphatase n=1 Tax=Falsiroseomonas sp. HW251 TaxID=3390998 RepID=UPI003D31A4DD